MKFNKLFSLSLIILISITFKSNAQSTYDFGFSRDFSVEVQDSMGVTYKEPWVGGMNATQFCPIDLNLDGIKDILVFDKHGNRHLTYINNGTPDSIDYTYAPEYERKFPQIEGWVKMADYDCDGKNDIFTYYQSGAGISLYRNISDSIDGLKFKLITKSILSFQGLFNSNIQASGEDYPGIVDIDNDGDLDILVFGGFGGTRIEFHKNHSMDSSGICGIDFRLVHRCWGYFVENDTSNAVTLNAICNWKSQKGSGAKHAGSTVLFIDIDNDKDKDLILGDVDYTNLAELTNGGDIDTARITSQNSQFPSNTVAVDLVSFPCPSYVDVNNDSLNDIIVSPFDGNPYAKAKGIDNTLYYKNTGNDTIPTFTYQQNDLFQIDMIEVGIASMPVLFDYNNDGLLDLFIGNYGYLDSTYMEYGDRYSIFRAQIALFENIGTQAQAKFKLITRDFANVSS